MSKAGSNNSQWKGGKYRSHGYIMIHSPNHPYRNSRNYVCEHRLMMEKKVGRYLIPNIDDVHHINGKRDDNRLVNLKLIRHGAHTRLTNTKDKSDRQCIKCERFHDEIVITYKSAGTLWYKKKAGWLCRSCNANILKKIKRGTLERSAYTEVV